MSVPLGSWLADLPDEGLIRLLELRPDLGQPAPGSMPALAARAISRQSVKVAADDLDFLRLATLDVLMTLGADDTAVPVAEVLTRLGGAPADAVQAALADLRARALVWGEAEVQVAAETSAALPWFPGQAVDVSGRSAADITAAIEALDGGARDLLGRLKSGSPVGRTRDAAAGTPADRPVQRLLAAGLLRRIDDETVILPRDIGQVLRGEEPGPADLTPPDPVVSKATAKVCDASAAGAALELLREVEVILESLSATPVPELRTGGLGVRESRRLAKTTGIDEQRLGLVLELIAAAGLIASGVPDPAPADDAPAYWAPTVAADRFLEAPTANRWFQLASTWLDLPSRPGLIGERGPDGKNYAALSDSLYSTAAPLDRRLLLGLMSELPTGAGVDAQSASRALIWRRPRWAARLQPGPVAHLLDEGHAVGLTGRGALSGPARILLSDGGEAAIAAMAKTLPEPIDYFLVQADLTVVVPGPLKRDLADELAAVAAVESAGAAMVYRVSEQSVRHALDTGRTAEALQKFFQTNSKTSVPQGLTYLINDVARRHGQLRVGMASAFLRCDDPTLLAHAVASPALCNLDVRLLAPTVAISQAPIAEVLTALRESGFAPAAEDSSGAIVDLRRRGARVPAVLPLRRLYRSAPKPNPETLAAVVSMLRRVRDAPLGGARIDPTVAIALLQQAAVNGRDVLMGYVDAAGVSTQRVLTPISVHGGHLMAFDPAQGRIREFAVHRVTSVMAAHDD
ncbi:MAG: helicase-associated domain-containing protein [Mycobacterium sp.]